MNRARFGAIRRTYLCALALTLSAFPLFSQVVERGRTYADLVSSHPCNSGNSGRLARVTDAQSSSSIGGGGGSTQVWAVCNGVDTWTLTSIGSAGGGAATAVTGSATLPATCTEKDLYQDTDSGGTEFYVCTATNTWTKTGSGTIGGTLGSNDNYATCVDGTGGSTIASCAGAPMLVPGGYPNSVGFIGDSNTGFYNSAGGHFNILCDDNNCADFSDQGLDPKFGIAIQPSKTLEWFSGVSTLRDIRLSRAAARTLALTDPAGSGAFFNQGGRVALTADYTNATATMSNITALTVTLVAARKYTFSMVLRLSDSVAGEGLKFDFDGGSGTATDFGVNCQVFDSALLLSADATALATDFAVATATGASKVVCDGSFTVNAAGTFIPRAAQNSHSSGTLTIETGSFLNIDDANFN